MFRKNVVIQFEQDTDILTKGSKIVVISSDAAYTQFVEVGSKEDGYLEEFTDRLLDFIDTGKARIKGSHKIIYGAVYWNHEHKKYIVPQMSSYHNKTKQLIIVYRTVNKKIKFSDRLSNRSYFITIDEFIMNCEYAGEF
jgi:hypothetical protein